MLTHIDRRYLDQVWPAVAPLLAQAVEKNHGEGDLAQLRAQVAYGGAELLVWQEKPEDAIRAVATVEWKQYPNYRAAWVSYMSGHEMAGAMGEVREWAKQQGASKIECLCGKAQAKLFEQRGFAEAYRLMRYDL